MNDQLSVSLLIEERSGIRRAAEPISVGIPFERGALMRPKSLVLSDANGQCRALQSVALAHWSDESVKWLLLDFQADVEPNGTAVYRICPGETTCPEDHGGNILVAETLERFVVNTGRATFSVNRCLYKPFDAVQVNGTELLSDEGTSFVLSGEDGTAYLPYIDDIVLETNGPVRATINAQGNVQSAAGKSLARFIARLSFYADSGFVEMRITLRNPRAARHPGGLWDLGDEGSIYFKDLSLHMPLKEQSSPEICWTTHPLQEGTTLAGDSVEIYQDSSGGENWHSTNHVNRFGQVMQSFRGYRVLAKEALIEEGLRATPTITMYRENGGVAGAIEKFWQNFPKAIEANRNKLTLRLFPCQYNDVFELQGGEQKSHTLYVEFSGPGEKRPDLGWVHDRLIPQATTDWYSKSKACNYLTPRSQTYNLQCLQLIDTAIDGPQSFFARREIIDEYGWRHFGDLYADHEAVGHTDDTPLVAHYNNQYDVIYGAIVQYLRGGDKRWFELASDLARHVIDIDIYHTQEDRPAFNGGLFWHTDHYLDAGTGTHRAYSKTSLKTKDARFYGGGPANEHNYTSGLLLYHYLTGSEAAREAVLSLADWVINMDDGSHRVLGWLDRRPTGLCSASASREYHGPGRGAGNSLNALVDAYLLTHEERYLAKAEEIIRRCIHPNDDFNARCLDNIEHHWSYLVFLQALGKYLDCKVDKTAIDYMYSYARASLVHYAEWMLNHEVPYATVLHKVEIPTETWPAQDIRKSIVFHMAARFADGPSRQKFRERGAFFFHACVNDLRSFPTCTLTRPIALLLSNAHVHSYFENHFEDMVYLSPESYDFGRPLQFSPQFTELYWARERLLALYRSVIDKGRAIRWLARKRQSSWGIHGG
jgi:PcRGLX-like N-terminal RIFT barrel domain